MKRHRFILLFTLFMLASISCFAQGQITTRREKLKDFATKTTKVVIPEDEYLAEAIREGVTSIWTVTPYEFCTKEEFERDKVNGNFYFLLIVNTQTKKESEPGIKELTLVKGGPEAAKGINSMLEVSSFPLCQAVGSNGREMIMIPAILSIVQSHASGLTDSELKAYMGIKVGSKDKKQMSKKRVYISRDDLAPQVSESNLSKLNEDIVIEDEDTVDDIMTDMVYNAAVSYVIAPEEPVNGSVCYKIIIAADTYELLYFKEHRITARNGKGFLPDDLSSINGFMK